MAKIRLMEMVMTTIVAQNGPKKKRIMKPMMAENGQEEKTQSV